jgi:hypothetical protein
MSSASAPADADRGREPSTRTPRNFGSIAKAFLLSPSELDTLLAQFQAVSEDDTILLILPRVWQVWGHKPAASPVSRL